MFTIIENYKRMIFSFVKNDFNENWWEQVDKIAQKEKEEVSLWKANDMFNSPDKIELKETNKLIEQVEQRLDEIDFNWDSNSEREAEFITVYLKWLLDKWESIKDFDVSMIIDAIVPLYTQKQDEDSSFYEKYWDSGVTDEELKQIHEIILSNNNLQSWLLKKWTLLAKPEDSSIFNNADYLSNYEKVEESFPIVKNKINQYILQKVTEPNIWNLLELWSISSDNPSKLADKVSNVIMNSIKSAKEGESSSIISMKDLLEKVNELLVSKSIKSEGYKSSEYDTKNMTKSVNNTYESIQWKIMLWEETEIERELKRYLYDKNITI